jgi:hypothetical protein
MEMDEMACVCGEVLRAPKEEIWRRSEHPNEEPPAGRGQLWKLYQEHMNREDHQPSQKQWLECHEKIVKARERAASFAKSTGSQ